ncbi:hypothetical protein A1F99_103820 [Pyrenophora tritici-repentis]|nr:hypothetical protein A1F99_103820 [Pyrenophora tritici-repentis]
MVYDTRPPKPAADKALNDWLSVPPKPTTDKIAIVNINGQQVRDPTLIISQETSGKIDCALCLGRTHRIVSLKATKQKRKIDARIVETAASLEVLEFVTGIKRATLEQNYDEGHLQDLIRVNHELHDRRAMQAAFHEQKKNIDIGVKKAKQEWQAAWAAVEGALDIIWTEAKVLKPHADPHAHDYGYSSLHNTPSTSSLKNTPSTTHGPEIPNTPSIQQGSTPDLGMAKFADFPITTPRGSSARARRVCAWRQFPAGAWNEEVVGNKRSCPVELTEWEQEFVNRVEKTVSSTSTAGDIMTPRQKPWKRVMESDDEEGEFRLPKRRSQRNKETNTQNATGPPQGTGGPEAGPSQQRNQNGQDQANGSTSSKRKRAEEEGALPQRKSPRKSISATPSVESPTHTPKRKSTIPEVFFSPVL